MVTVAVRRVPLDRSAESFLDHLDPACRSCRTRPAVIRLKTPFVLLAWRGKRSTPMIKLEVMVIKRRFSRQRADA